MFKALPFQGRRAGAVMFAILLSAATVGCTPGEQRAEIPDPAFADVASGPAVMRRLTQAQYKNSVRDIFGADIEIGGRFEPEHREAGLLAVGASQVSVPASGLEQYSSMARSIAAQVFDAKRRDSIVGCGSTTTGAAFDRACARAFIEEVGRILYRRPLTAQERDTQVASAEAAANVLGSFHGGLEFSLVSMLEAPQFLFVLENIEPDPARPGSYRLDAYAKAARLSFFLWNAAPDPILLEAARTGALHTRKGIEREVARMIQSPRLRDGVRAFFADMLEFDKFGTLSKDTAIYPKFATDVAVDAQEQTLRTVVDHLIAQDGDYRDLFTTQKTFLTRTLGSIYHVPVKASHGWEPFTFDPAHAQSGLITQVGFVSLHSHPGRTSPTLRGKALREVLLCQKVPDPPGNVNFGIVQDTAHPDYRTVRQRLQAHATEAMCKGCHKITDPMGLALENFDTVGEYRVRENDAAIDTSGELDGVKFTDAQGLGKALRDNPAAVSCLVSRMYAYASGRAPTKSEGAWVRSSLVKSFAGDGHKVPALMRRIATSALFFRAAPESPPQTASTVPEK